MVLWLGLQVFTTAAKLLQSCLTLCDPLDGSPLGSAVPGIRQARILEWVATAFSTGFHCLGSIPGQRTETPTSHQGVTKRRGSGEKTGKEAEMKEFLAQNQCSSTLYLFSINNCVLVLDSSLIAK